jgi:hypothetical protein
MGDTVNPIYGASRTPCPAPPAGNKNLITYMNRVQSIMTDLVATRKKQVAIDRLDVLIAEINTTTHTTCGGSRAR